jgi:hypothetical protein
MHITITFKYTLYCGGKGRGQRYEENTLRKLTSPLDGDRSITRAIGKGEPWKLRTFWGPELADHVHIITIVPALLYSPSAQWFWLEQIHCSGYWKGWALKISLICTTEIGQFLYFVPASFIFLPPPTPNSWCWANMFICPFPSTVFHLMRRPWSTFRGRG